MIQKITSVSHLRVRINWRGKLILQVRKKIKTAQNLPRPGQNLKWKLTGFTKWCDADGKNAEEIAEIAKLLLIRHRS